MATFTNPSGSSILEDIKTLKSDHLEMKKSIDAQFSKIDSQHSKNDALKSGQIEMEARIDSLEERVRSLTTTSDGYLEIRRRFYDTYKRDIKGNTKFRHTAAIQTGDKVAHGGDVLTDAIIFDRDGGGDVSIQRELYNSKSDKDIQER